jgi:phage-related minor tail protein
MNVFDLFAKIGLDTSEYDKGIDESKDKMTSLKDNFAKGAKSVAAGAGVFATMGAAAYKAAEGVSKNLDQIDKMSQKLGLSRKAYQEWDYVLQISGADINSMGAGLKTLVNKFDDAMTGSSSAIETFERLGLSMEEIQGLSREDLFGKVITQFQNMEDSAERAALANDIFGRSGQELAPLFNTTSEETARLIQQVNDLGGVMSDDAVKNGAAFQDSMTAVKAALSGAGAQLVEKLIPAITDFANKITDFIASGGLDRLIELLEVIGPLLIAVASGFGLFKIVSGVVVIVQTGITVFTTLGTVLQSLWAIMLANPITIVIAAITALVAAFVYLWNNSESFRQFWIGLWDNIKDTVAIIGEWLKNFFTKTIPGFFEDAINFLRDIPGAAKEWGSDLIKNFVDGIKSKFDDLKNGLKNAAQTVKDFLGFSEPDKGPLSDFHTYAPDMMELFASGIKDNAKLLTDAVRDTFDIQPVIQKTTNQTTNGAQVAGAGFNGTIVIPVYMGDQYLTEAVVTAEQINDYVTGGRG